MAKEGIHNENYHKIVMEVYDVDGKKKTFESASTYKGDKLVSDVNISKHQAWIDNSKFDEESSQNKNMQKFLNKLGKCNFTKNKKSSHEDTEIVSETTADGSSSKKEDDSESN